MGRKRLTDEEKAGAALARLRRLTLEITKEGVMLSRKEPHICCGVYFLIKNEEIIYIGKSKNVQSRIGDHALCVDFDSYSVVECDPEFVLEAERILINKFNPHMNKHHNELFLQKLFVEPMPVL